jgi:PPK2 family polyphosphate:nucleotide phosphotransferase
VNVLDKHRVKPNSRLRLHSIPTNVTGGLKEDDAKEELKKLLKRMEDLHELMYADGRQSLLVVLQAMDTAGKDSTIKSVFTGFNPIGCSVTAFKAPNDTEKKHDFLWRIHQHAPRRGHISIFNRSHYEDVLIVRVKKLVPAKQVEKRYAHINAFEKMLHDEGTRIVKFYLHISKEYQKERLIRRLSMPDKLWKFDPNDLVERKLWPQYRRAYEEAMQRCSTPDAPWYIIPSETRWYRDLLIARVLVQTMESMKMKYPKPTFDPNKIRIRELT